MVVSQFEKCLLESHDFITMRQFTRPLFHLKLRLKSLLKEVCTHLLNALQEERLQIIRVSVVIRAL